MEGEGQTGGGGGGSGGAVDSDAWVWWQRQAAAVTPTDHLTRLPVTWPYLRPVRFFRPSLGMSLPLRPPSPSVSIGTPKWIILWNVLRKNIVMLHTHCLIIA